MRRGCENVAAWVLHNYKTELYFLCPHWAPQHMHSQGSSRGFRVKIDSNANKVTTGSSKVHRTGVEKVCTFRDSIAP